MKLTLFKPAEKIRRELWTRRPALCNSCEFLSSTLGFSAQSPVWLRYLHLARNTELENLPTAFSMENLGEFVLTGLCDRLLFVRLGKG